MPHIIHLPQIVYTIGYISIAAIVLMLVVLAILKLRNRNRFGGK
jgi:hypothetical protein